MVIPIETISSELIRRTSVSHSETTAAPRRIFKFPSLGIQILIALALGILVGTLLHDYGAKTWVIENILNPAGKVLITMIKMIVVPIVISTLTVGIAGGLIEFNPFSNC
ncbi:MAG TPA: cation:dicarboxylase symporter family transporter [Candidatus Ignatzschineria merdigallinarum]|uniref:Cation:dicarboxylase symporter family transporter n=1 Tax=Candidatus Ignatzschineria merdigallinarum TaxID=2838621 RepID=A0A9D1Q8A6_9GAMM|nr:cation:dicarboxylase symporter family transporter [Candidatus Ignatzschineria merdigallinarum]